VEYLTLIPKAKETLYFCQTVFQLKESDLKKYRKGRQLPIYRLPLDSAEIDEKYTFRSEMQYALHLPFYRFLHIWDYDYSSVKEVDKQYLVGWTSKPEDEVTILVRYQTFIVYHFSIFFQNKVPQQLLTKNG
jgi:hypothetical protein